MSLNKRRKTDHKLREESMDCSPNIRQSLDRFDDNLIQKLVHYLPLKDKLHFFTVNKRLKKCLSLSQLDLIIDHKIGNRFNTLAELEDSEEEDSDDSDYDSVDLDYFLKISKSALNYMLKTFTGIESLDLRNSSLDSHIIDIICDNNCPKLQSIMFTDFGIDRKCVQRLGQTYGQQLSALRIQNSFNGIKSGFDKLFLNYCHNLSHIYCESIESFSDRRIDFLPALENISAIIDKNHDLDSLQIIVDKYKNQLKSLTLFIHLDDSNDINRDLDLISSLVSLKTMNLDFFDPKMTLRPIDESIKKIAINCKDLDSFRISFNCCSNCLVSTNLLKTFGYFTQITTLSAQLLVSEEEDNESVVKTEELMKLNISCLIGCKRLTHLDISFAQMTDNFVENIEVFSPNLRSIRLSSAQDLSDLTLNSLNRLKHLKSLKITRNRFKTETFPKITDLGITELMSSCPSIRSLVFIGRPNISEKSMNIFIRLAKECPKNSYYFECNYKDVSTDGQMFPKFDVNSEDIPKNLMIRIEKMDELEDLDDNSYDVSMDLDSISGESTEDIGQPLNLDKFED